MRILIRSLSVLALLGCQSQPMPVTLQGDPSGIASLAGRWEGQYWGAGTGRAGSINFSLAGSRDSVFGEVTMVDNAGRTLRSGDPSDQHQIHARSAQSLAIAFVQVGNGQVSGKLEPYIAPDCNCPVTTTFTGTVRADSIVGTFLTTVPTGGADQGRWGVARTARPR